MALYKFVYNKYVNWIYVSRNAIYGYDCGLIAKQSLQWNIVANFYILNMLTGKYYVTGLPNIVFKIL